MRFWPALAAVLLCAASLSAAGLGARELFRAGRKAEREGRYLQAYSLYSQALAAAPENREYWFRREAVDMARVFEGSTRVAQEHRELYDRIIRSLQGGHADQ